MQAFSPLATHFRIVPSLHTAAPMPRITAGGHFPMEAPPAVEKQLQNAARGQRNWVWGCLGIRRGINRYTPGYKSEPPQIHPNSEFLGKRKIKGPIHQRPDKHLSLWVYARVYAVHIYRQSGLINYFPLGYTPRYTPCIYTHRMA